MEREGSTGELQRVGDADLVALVQRAIVVMDAYINVPESRQFKEDWAAWLNPEKENQ
jgi:hypothetical protein